MPCFESFYGSFFVLVLEGVGVQFSGDPHAQLKSGDEGRQGGLLLQLDLQVFDPQQRLPVLPG